MNAVVAHGTGEVYVVDNVPARLEKAGELGAFRRFDRREDSYIKVILDPAGS